MKNFKSGNRSRNRKDSSRRNFGGRDSRRPLLHDAVCDECGKDCQVPFKPTGEKPVYCSDCFEKKGGRDSDRSSRRVFRRRSFRDRDSGRSSQNNVSDRSISQLTEKIEILNTKLDKIIDLFSKREDHPAERGGMKRKKTNSPKAKPEDTTGYARGSSLSSVEEKKSELAEGKTKKSKVESKTEKNKKPKNTKADEIKELKQK